MPSGGGGAILRFPLARLQNLPFGKWLYKMGDGMAMRGLVVTAKGEIAPLAMLHDYLNVGEHLTDFGVSCRPDDSPHCSRPDELALDHPSVTVFWAINDVGVSFAHRPNVCEPTCLINGANLPSGRINGSRDYLKPWGKEPHRSAD